MEEPEDAWKQKLIKNLVYLVDNLDLNVRLLAQLKQAHVLAEWNEEEIMETKTHHSRRDAFVTYLKKRPENDYRLFLKALIDSNQRHVAEKLDGAILNPNYPLKCPEPFLDIDNADSTDGMSKADCRQEPIGAIASSPNQSGSQIPLDIAQGSREHIAVIGGISGTRRSPKNPKIELFQLTTGNDMITTSTTPFIEELPLPLESVSGIRFALSLWVLGLNSDKITFLEYNPLSGKWHLEHPLVELISRGSILSFDGEIYVYGVDQSSTALLLHLWRHSLDSKWEVIDRRPIQREDFAAVTLGRYLYVIGGRCKDVSLNTVERYSFDHRTWRTVAPLRVARSGVAVAVLDNYIYVCGGRDDKEELTHVACERYSAANDKWDFMHPMSRPRFQFSLVSLGGQLIAIGGADEEGFICHPAFEIYNPKSNIWTITDTRLNERRKGHTAVIIKNPK